MPILQYFAKKQVGSLPNPEATLCNARFHTKFRCFGNWHLIEVITREDLIVAKARELMSFHFIFVTNFIRDKHPLYDIV